jgi:hypothetical protein
VRQVSQHDHRRAGGAATCRAPGGGDRVDTPALLLAALPVGPGRGIAAVPDAAVPDAVDRVTGE